MDIKSKKSKRTLFTAAFVVCVCSFLVSVVGVIGAATLNSYTGYMDPYFLRSNGYSSYDEFLQDHDSGFVFQSNSMQSMEYQMKIWTIVAIATAVISLITLIYMVVTVGQRDKDGKICLSRFDEVFGEVQLAGIVIIFFIGGGYFTGYVTQVVNAIYGIMSLTSFEMALDVTGGAILGVGATVLGLGLILSCVKKIKAGEFLHHSLCGWLVNKIYTEIYRGGSTMQRVVMVALLICLLSATVFLAPVMLIVILVYAPKWVHKYDEIKNGIKEVNSGNLDYKIPVEGDGELDQLAEGINEITEATSIAVQNELKNQRMKTDLISNVSHDLKTPLTSMVTYIDLLKTEGLDSENAMEYVDVLEQKTNRLRQLTEDLFEAAKASSGAIPVRMSRVDLLSLLNQGMGELNEKIEESQLEFIINADKIRYLVKADGQLLWRVISNLLGNALKYSQENTRVYVEFQERKSDHGDLVVMEMKNISKYCLNINPEDLMERFKRGDESRSTEGSGLGLAIAKDLMKLMGGWIELDIDGDLFKARVLLEAAAEDEPVVTPMTMDQEPMETEEELQREMESEEKIEDMEPISEPEAEPAQQDDNIENKEKDS